MDEPAAAVKRKSHLFTNRAHQHKSVHYRNFRYATHFLRFFAVVPQGKGHGFATAILSPLPLAGEGNSLGYQAGKTGARRWSGRAPKEALLALTAAHDDPIPPVRRAIAEALKKIDPSGQAHKGAHRGLP